MPTSCALLPLPDLSGQTVVITGGAAGIGLATARGLADAGAHVVLAVRDTAKGQAAARTIAGAVDVRRLDLADLASVRGFADAWGERDIAVLINNACAVSPTLAHTVDGFELQFGTSHLGHFALTNLLLPRITDRVVNVSSQAERMGRFDRDDLAYTAGDYTQTKAYNRAKLAGLLFSAELQRRLIAAGSAVRSHAAHPGFVATGIYAGAGPATRLLVRMLAQPPEQGALPVLAAATAQLAPDSFIGPAHAMHMRGAPTAIPRSRAAKDPELAAWLWTVSERLTGVAWATPARGIDAAQRTAPQRTSVS